MAYDSRIRIAAIAFAIAAVYGSYTFFVQTSREPTVPTTPSSTDMDMPTQAETKNESKASAYVPKPIKEPEPISINRRASTKFTVHDVSKAKFSKDFLELHIDFIGKDAECYYLIDSTDDNVFRIPVSSISLQELSDLQSTRDGVIRDRVWLPLRPILSRTEEYKKWRAELKLK